MVAPWNNNDSILTEEDHLRNFLSPHHHQEDLAPYENPLDRTHHQIPPQRSLQHDSNAKIDEIIDHAMRVMDLAMEQNRYIKRLEKNIQDRVIRQPAPAVDKADIRRRTSNSFHSGKDRETPAQYS